MPANKRPRKSHRRVQIFSTPIAFRHNAEEETALQLAPHLSLSKFRQGIADEQDWHTLAARVNVGSIAANWHDQSEAIGAMNDGLHAIRSVSARHQRTQAWGITGDELKAIGEALNLTDEIQKGLTRREMASVIRYVFNNAGVK